MPLQHLTPVLIVVPSSANDESVNATHSSNNNKYSNDVNHGATSPADLCQAVDVSTSVSPYTLPVILSSPQPYVPCLPLQSDTTAATTTAQTSPPAAFVAHNINN
uniref:Uncharacterized protein n=1 Tax=Lygus hesperus TaxID=30085 RepID=A0A0A9XX66_LYGHE